jgi:hypothetical protein
VSHTEFKIIEPISLSRVRIVVPRASGNSKAGQNDQYRLLPVMGKRFKRRNNSRERVLAATEQFSTDSYYCQESRERCTVLL